ncbi:MAG: site-specific integrase [Methanomassiliicoccales archaeon]
MPYAERGPFHVAMREWLRDLRPPEATSAIGVITKKSYRDYKAYVLEAGQLLGFPKPSTVTLEQMRLLESRFRGSEGTVSIKASIFRQFLRSTGNRDAFRWRIKAKQGAPCKTRIWMHERQVAQARMEAQKMGITMELLYTLAVDMGLRAVDCQRLTLKNAEDFLLYGRSIIRGKGRNGGKLAEQFFSDMARDPLIRYMNEREKWVAETGVDYDLLLVRKVRTHRKLVPIDYQTDIREPTEILSEACGFMLHYHDCRATFGNRLFKRGYSIEIIAKLMRHDNPDVTFKRYIGADQDTMRNAMDSLCPGASVQQLGIRQTF